MNSMRMMFASIAAAVTFTGMHAEAAGPDYYFVGGQAKVLMANSLETYHLAGTLSSEYESYEQSIQVGSKRVYYAARNVYLAFPDGDSAKAAIAGSNAVSEMANHSQPILGKLEAIEKRLADLELQIDRVEKNGCCLVM